MDLTQYMLLLEALKKSGIGIIEGLYSSTHSLEEISEDMEEKNKIAQIGLSVNNQFIGKHDFMLASLRTTSEFMTYELWDKTENKAFLPLKGHGDTIYLRTIPFKEDVGGYCGRFVLECPAICM